jgi:hypothetical protein
MIHAFGDFEVDEEPFELRRASRLITLEPTTFRVLADLVPQRDRAVPSDEIRKQFRPGEFVTDFALAHCISNACQAVGSPDVAQEVDPEVSPKVVCSFSARCARRSNGLRGAARQRTGSSLQPCT